MPIVIPTSPPAVTPPPPPPVLATSAPEIPLAGEYLLDEVGVAQPGDERRGWAARLLVGAVGKALGPLHDIVRDTDAGPGWSPVLDPDRAPAWALGWLAQFAGVFFPADLPEAEKRRRITMPPAFERGTPSAMTKAVLYTLTGSAPYVFFKEREGSPYRVTIVTRTTETPDAAGTFAAAKAQKPAGLILTHLATTARLYVENTTIAPTYAARSATYATYAAARGF